MSTALIRLIFIYFITMLSLRLTGKRQIGQMQMSELVCAFFLSELATYPVTNQNIPLFYGIVPVIAIICLEVALSFASTKINWIRRLFDPSPSILIRGGKLDTKELARARLTVEELFSQLRLKEVSDPSEVAYAILEPNGQLSVIRREEDSPPTRGDCSIPARESGIQHLIYSDGVYNRRCMRALNLDRAKVNALFQKKNVHPKDVFLLSVNDEGKTFLIQKETT